MFVASRAMYRQASARFSQTGVGAGLRRHDVEIGRADRPGRSVSPAQAGIYASFRALDAQRVHGRAHCLTRS